MATIVTASGRRKLAPVKLDASRIRGLDEEGRIVVDNFDGDAPFLFGLTLCCDASDKGIDTGIVCRGCYGEEDTGSYLYPDGAGSFVGLDPIKELVS